MYLDEYYCCIQFKYFKERVVEEREIVVVFFCDDKVKIFVGEFDVLILIGVKGKKIFVLVSIILVVKDYDMYKLFLILLVILQCDVLNVVNQLFVCGIVINIVNDFVFEMFSFFRYVVVLIKVFLNSLQKDVKILMKFTDGGTD